MSKKRPQNPEMIANRRRQVAEITLMLLALISALAGHLTWAVIFFVGTAVVNVVRANDRSLD